MRKIANILVKRRYLILIVMLAFTVLSGTMMKNVNIITDSTKFLPDDSSMKTGVGIMEEELSKSSVENTISIMFNGLTDEEKEGLKIELGDIQYVDSVNYQGDDTHYNKENHTLYVLNIPYDYSSEEMDSVETALQDTYSDQYDMIYSVDNVDGSDLPLWILAIALVLLMIILFIMCNSWIEPFLFLFTIGVAIIINMGTNALLSGVSDKTYSVSAILQLVLSMDYSIILMNRYRQEMKLQDNHLDAMKSAIGDAFASITTSSLTTIVGLLALIFMSFKIGADMGIVLAKGVVISMFCIFTVLPALILIFDKLIKKTTKKELTIKMDVIGRFSYRFRFIILGVFIVFFASLLFTKGSTKIAYTMPNNSEVYDVFTKTNKMVMLYNNDDELATKKLISEIENNDRVESVVAYSNTIGQEYTKDEMEDALGKMDSDTQIDTTIISLIYYDNYKNGEIESISLDDFTQFIQNDILSNEMFSSQIDEKSIAQINKISYFSSVEALNEERSSTELGQILDMDYTMIDSIFAMSGTSTMSIQQFLQLMNTDPRLAANLSAVNEESLQQLQQLQAIINGVMDGKLYSATELSDLFGKNSDAMTPSTIDLLLTLYFSMYNSDPEWTMSIAELLDHAVTSMAINDKYASFFDEDTVKKLNIAKDEIEEASKQLKGTEHSILVISTNLPEESQETNDFIEALMAKSDGDFSSDYYLIGNSPLQYEISSTFGDELNKITIITALAIFIVIMIGFQSFVIPLILVLIIQAAVYATVVIIGIQGFSIHFMALLIVQSILMGATIDYGILFTTYYREKRKSMGIKEAVIGAYDGSIHTILTSGLIMVVVTGILGRAFEDPTIGEICNTLSMGAICALILIVFILPGIIAVFDKLVYKVKKS